MTGPSPDVPKQVVVTDPVAGTTIATVVQPAAPSQTRHPWRTTLRTDFQLVVAAAAGAPVLYQAITQHSATEATGAAAVALGVASAVTRVMALPQVNAWLTRLGLGAEPRA